MPIALVAVAVAAGGAAYASHKKAEGQKKAIDKQVEAIRKLKDIDLEKSKRLVSDQDKQLYKDSLAFFREQNPDLAAASDAAVKNIRADLEGAPGSAAEQSTQVLNTLYGEILPKDQRLEQARQLLIDSATEDLKRGATFSPDFQAELVRSGLEQAAQTGVGLDRSGPVTSRLGTLLGTAGEQLKSLRQQRASEALGTADALTQSRASVLGNLLGNVEGARQNNRNAALQAFGLGEAVKTPIGLSGREVLNLDLTNLAMNNKKLMDIAKLKGAQEVIQAGQTADIVQSSTGFAANALSGAAGGAPVSGGASGGGFQFGSILNGLLSQNKPTQSTPTWGTF